MRCNLARDDETLGEGEMIEEFVKGSGIALWSKSLEGCSNPKQYGNHEREDSDHSTGKKLTVLSPQETKHSTTFMLYRTTKGKVGNNAKAATMSRIELAG